MKFSCFILFMCFANYCQAIKVTFINPSVPGTAFWDRVTAAAVAAADDLSIELTVLYGRDNRIFNLETIEQAVNAQDKPDYIIFMPYDGNSVQTFDLLEAAKIPFITIERTLQPKEQALVSLPQIKYKYWLGEIFHDNIVAGKLLSDTLIDEAKLLNGDKPINVVGISGSFSGESSERTLGLETSIAEQTNATLLQVVPAIWSRERSRNIIHQLASRFGHIDVAWAASDGMALGVLDSIHSGHGSINPKMLIGGIDWTVEAINKIKSGELTASVGGHLMQTAWALVKIYDHHHGYNAFVKGANEKTYDLEVINKHNIMRYFILARKLNWQRVDFKRFTLKESQLSHYQFSFDSMLSELN